MCAPECNVSVDKSLTLWKMYIPSKHATFFIKSFELYAAKSDYVWNMYIGQVTIFGKSLKIGCMAQK
jgi:hypothetical protein